MNAHAGALIIEARRKLLTAPAGPLINIGAGGSNAQTSFTLNPLALGAQSGDLMVVGGSFEQDSAVTTPAGWTEARDASSNAGGSAHRHVIAHRTFSGAPPGDQTWSYGGSNGAFYGWAILRGCSFGAIHIPTAVLSGPYSMPVTIGAKGALAFIDFDGFSTEDPSTIVGLESDVDVAAAAVNAATAGYYTSIGWMDASGTVNINAGAGGFTYGQLASWWLEIN